MLAAEVTRKRPNALNERSIPIRRFYQLPMRLRLRAARRPRSHVHVRWQLERHHARLYARQMSRFARRPDAGAVVEVELARQLRAVPGQRDDLVLGNRATVEEYGDVRIPTVCLQPATGQAGLLARWNLSRM